MTSRKKAKPSGYWTRERCVEEAAKYQHRNDFKKGNGSAYTIASRNGWLNDICEHMTPKSSRLIRHVYEIADHEQQKVYVGLTYDVLARACQHRASVKMQKHFPAGINLHVLRSNLTELDAQKAEEHFVNLYKSIGYEVVNRHRTGGLGGSKLIYDFDYCQMEALKYQTRAEFRSNARYVYARAQRRKWLNDICQHMKELKKPNGYWTRDRILSESKKYDDYTSFIRVSKAYQPASVLGMLVEVQQLLSEGIRKPRGYWTLETILRTASSYASYSDFIRSESSAYATAWRLRVTESVVALFDEPPTASNDNNKESNRDAA